MSENRYNIGLLVANITDEFSNSLAVGAMKAAKRLNTDLIIFPGKYMGLQRLYEKLDTKYEYQYNVLFDYAARGRLDYIIAAVGTIAYAFDNERKKEFLNKFAGTPVLCVASEIEGYDFLQFDNESGIINAVDYLASHGRKYIGIMVGDLNSYECVQRFNAYKKGLEKNGLKYSKKYVMTCDISPECRDEAELLIDKNPDMDAVLCVNDKIASVIYEVLNDRNIKVGEDVAVVGFDDLPLCTKLNPPLTSIRADAQQLGETAVEKAVNFLNGIKDERHFVGTQFISRQSCFSLSPVTNSNSNLFSGNIENIRKNIDSYINNISENTETSRRLENTLKKFVEQLYQSCIKNKTSAGDCEKTETCIAALSFVMEYSKLASLLDEAYVWLVRNCLEENIPYVKKLGKLFHTEKDSLMNERLIQEYSERTHYNNVFIRDSLMTDVSLTDSYAKILKRLCNVGAMTGFIYLLEKPVRHLFGDEFPETDLIFESYHYGAEAFIVSKENQRIPTPKVFKNDCLCVERQHIFIVADLYTADTQYGIALLEPASEAFFKDFELVTYQLSSVVRTLDILKKQDELLKELHTRNLALDKMSKIDSMTMVYNRRGFYLAAEELIGRPENQGKSFIICYADMDGLKKINDTYGHLEGDYSINLLADCLKFAFGSDAVIARMGGDEFAVICPLSENVSAEQVRKRKEEFVKDFNDSGKKPYFFDVSMGLIECPCSDTFDLSSLLSKTDEILYTEKSQKKAKASL